VVEIVSDVSCRYSLGTNPRGVKGFGYYTNRVEIVCIIVVVITHACIIAITHACIIVHMNDS
jgi:hypothetical protein